jgi:hypothetical protein
MTASKADLYTTLSITAEEFEKLVEKTKHYRDKFVAHLDKELVMLLPALDVAKGAVVFLHERLVQQGRGHQDWSGLATSPEELEQGFTQASREAETVYVAAMDR